TWVLVTSWTSVTATATTSTPRGASTAPSHSTVMSSGKTGIVDVSGTAASSQSRRTTRGLLSRRALRAARRHARVGSGARRPTAVFIDDIDWADRATLDLVRHVLFRMADEPVALLLVGTSRSDPGARAAGGLSRLRSDPRVATVSLHPLTELEATEFARQLEP